MGMSTRAHIQSLSSIVPILVKIFEVVERWVPVEVWVHDSSPLERAPLAKQCESEYKFNETSAISPFSGFPFFDPCCIKLSYRAVTRSGSNGGSCLVFLFLSFSYFLSNSGLEARHSTLS